MPTVVDATFKKHTACGLSFGGEYKDKWECKMSDGTMQTLEYFGDEISFSKDELIGRTWDQVKDLYNQKDLAYLRGAPVPEGSCCIRY